MDRDGRFQKLSLIVHRSVIDDGVSEMQARDIVKSFLADVTPLKDVAAIGDWISDIRGRPIMPSYSLKRDGVSGDEMMDFVKMNIEAGKEVVLRMGKAPQLPEVPTDGFAVFKGETKECERHLAESIVWLANETIEGTTALFVSISPPVPRQ
jgi:hypothetical protein